MIIESSAHFFMTWRLTFWKSTFWLNSGGNFVARRSLASTLDAMMVVYGGGSKVSGEGAVGEMATVGVGEPGAAIELLVDATPA